MKIGIDVRLWNETGVGRYIRNLVRNITVLDNRNTYVLFARAEDVSVIEQIIPKTWKIVTTTIHWHSLSEQVSFLPILYKEQLDLMHFPYFSLPVLYNRPFVVTIHDLIIHSFATGRASTLPLPLYHLKRFGYKKVIEEATKKAVKVIVPLEAVKKDVEETLGIVSKQIVVTKEGFDTTITEKHGPIRTQLTDKKKYFLYVGNAYPHKNIENLVTAFLRFQKIPGNEEYSLVLVGKEDYFYGKIKKMYAKEKNVQFLHNVSDSELGYLYNHAIALVSASRMEGFGLPCLEAAECECLIAVSDIPSFKEVCGEHALYFSPISSEQITPIFSEILSLSVDKRKTLIDGAKNHAKIYSWQKMTQETIKLYESCVSI